MGFLEGLLQTGQYYNLLDNAGDLSDIVNYLELPLAIPAEDSDTERRPRVIRVALKVADPDAIPLDVQGIETITLADYPAMPVNKLIDVRKKFLHRETPSNNKTWSYSPIYRLWTKGKPTLEKLIGHSGKGWRKDKDSQYYKVHRSILEDLEKSGTFNSGSVDNLMKSLIENSSKLLNLWQVGTGDNLLVFGLMSPSGFSYPGDIPAFTSHFRNKLLEQRHQKTSKKLTNCMLCGRSESANRTLDQVFKFSTFDKPGFLPGGIESNISSVFPICEICFEYLSRGYTEEKENFAMRIGISSLTLHIIPEFFGGAKDLTWICKRYKDFLSSGVDWEQDIFNDILQEKASFVTHFLFTEKNNAQIRLHRMVEDIPPSHFCKLRNLWQLKKVVFFPPRTKGERKQRVQSLDAVIRQIVAMVLSLAAKTDEEKAVIKDWVTNLIADLFSNAYIDVEALKRLVVSRLPGLLTDPKWLNASDYPGNIRLDQWWMFFEFLYTYNNNLDQEEVRLQ